MTDADIPPDWIKTLTLKRRPCTYLPVAMASPGGANTNTLTADCSELNTESDGGLWPTSTLQHVVLSHRSITSLLSKQQHPEKKCCDWVFENQWKRFYENTAIMQQPHYWYSCCCVHVDFLCIKPVSRAVKTTEVCHCSSIMWQEARSTLNTLDGHF